VKKNHNRNAVTTDTKRRYDRETPLRTRNAVTEAKRRYGREKSVTNMKSRKMVEESCYQIQNKKL
jgi:ribosomal protein S21